MSIGPEILKHGTPARLFPVYSDSCKEQRSISILLATMLSVRPFAERVLDALNVKVRKRTTIHAYTEVTLTNDVKGMKDRPDALLVVENGKSMWTALIEAKVGKNPIDQEQLERYANLARINNIDAIITVSNELTPAPTIHPVVTGLKKVDLFHFSWSSLLTKAFLLAASTEQVFENDDELFLVSELVRYLEHPGSGRLPLDQMNKDWPQCVADVQAGLPISAKSNEVMKMVATWYQEARDVALIMTRNLHEPVTMTLTRNEASNPLLLNETGAKGFAENKTLEFELEIPNAASRLKVEADFLRRRVRCSMRLQAPTDKASNSARVNWMLRQLQKSDCTKVILRCGTKGKGKNYGALASEIDAKSDIIKELGDISYFQVEMTRDLGSKFNSRKKFVEGLEALVPEFYENVGQHLKAWVAPPPKVKRTKSDTIPTPMVTPMHQESPRAEETPVAAIAEPRPVQRPDWATAWKDAPPGESADNAESTDHLSKN